MFHNDQVRFYGTERLAEVIVKLAGKPARSFFLIGHYPRREMIQLGSLPPKFAERSDDAPDSEDRANRRYDQADAEKCDRLPHA